MDLLVLGRDDLQETKARHLSLVEGVAGLGEGEGGEERGEELVGTGDTMLLGSDDIQAILRRRKVDRWQGEGVLEVEEEEEEEDRWSLVSREWVEGNIDSSIAVTFR